MTNTELTLRIALVALIREFEHLCSITNKTPGKNSAYLEAVKLMEVKSD